LPLTRTFDAGILRKYPVEGVVVANRRHHSQHQSFAFSGSEFRQVRLDGARQSLPLHARTGNWCAAATGDAALVGEHRVKVGGVFRAIRAGLERGGDAAG
jgi:hypothetical protein